VATVQKYLQGMFEEDEEGECPPLAMAMVRAAEAKLGYHLPAAYVELLKVCNRRAPQAELLPDEEVSQLGE
jgi:hypothetical protein